ncbi:U1 zinc finger domain protein [Zymoseptoria brevis]|uniref:U1 zinc finger domain protein n=1 Tax=Zymoseptoria brevis TaxID=1047168 RepID=A0A0F4GCN9_9PEZI|nr:U1 zinc finger domain protein [Zymoseptoria brevis]
MSEYWKSTPSYWCKFCSQYVRDSPLERKNHEASGKHQNNIQRNLRELHKGREREERDKQRAKDEVARLNGLVGDKSGSSKSTIQPPSRPAQAQPAATPLSLAAQRKAHAEQLAAMGVDLPEELKKEVTGVGNYHVVAERVVSPTEGGATSAHRSLAEILADAKRGDVGQPQNMQSEDEGESISRRAYKRKAEEIEGARDEEAASKRQAWGSNIKTYPRKTEAVDDGPDLDALLNGVKKKESEAKKEKTEEGGDVKQEMEIETTKPLSEIPDVSSIKPEVDAGSSAPAVMFKKRRGKK